MTNITQLLTREVATKKTPSVQYAFFDADSIIYEFSDGVKNVKANAAVTGSTTYNLFSVTKTFTALAVLQLAQSGKVQLNKPVVNYLPDFPYSNQITVQQLLAHSSGMPNPLPLQWVHQANNHKDFNHDLFFKKILQKHPKLHSAPGTRFKYSNLGYVILGQLIEQVSGQPFEVYIQENIIKPAGIDPGSLGFHIDDSRHATGYHKQWSLSNLALGFLMDKSKLMGATEGPWKPFNHFYVNGTAYGGMIGSRTGLIQYARLLLQKDSTLLNWYYRNLLFTESVIDDQPTGMSLSWFTGTLKGNRYLAHAGGGGGYYVEVRIYPDLGVGSVILFNRSGLKDERLLDNTDSFFITEQPVAKRQAGVRNLNTY